MELSSPFQSFTPIDVVVKFGEIPKGGGGGIAKRHSALFFQPPAKGGLKGGAALYSVLPEPHMGLFPGVDDVGFGPHEKSTKHRSDADRSVTPHQASRGARRG